ncbi:delta 1-pyrroline-5-carboxylate synthetase [Methylophaga sp.]|uniref:amino acid kinase family protein n=1 Tax=Methylophaga sp. TaxID=2024840 RepID=UPI00271B7B0E|nr:delta 1-pyrroline-5-carboxylate synthetase [Methylophaga sp.]MDO8826589.1 delta 1-pyrroline-5-carboxylate synthetase [Methylophaga sp.]
MLIVKLGGSLYHSAELKSWLTLLSQYAENDSVVIVPGGGPFADMVRQSQALHKFDDQHAHHMALLAMAQYGLLLHALQPAAITINTPAEAPIRGQLAIWLPDDQLLQADELKQSWDITSDSLALWFTQQHAQSKLILIKCAPVTTGDIHVLSENSIIDRGFQALFQQHPVETYVVHYQQLNDFPDGGVVLR